MGGPAARERARVRELADCLRTVRIGEGPALASLVAPLGEILGADQMVAYGFSLFDRHLALDFFHSEGSVPASRMRQGFDDFLRIHPPVGWTYHNPLRPEPSQRNRVMTSEDLLRGAKGVEAPVVGLLAGLGVDAHQVRVLVCEGSSLLAWVGGMRAEPFTRREREILGLLTRPLRERLRLERRMGDAPIAWAALAAVLERIPAAAFLVRGGSEIVQANAAGLALRGGNRTSLERALRESILRGGAGAAFDVAPLSARGVPGYALAVLRDPPADALPRVRVASQRWALTPRQAEVLALLASGKSNRTAAVELGCSEKTMEVHVSAILGKAACGTRSELVARLWSMR